MSDERAHVRRLPQTEQRLTELLTGRVDWGSFWTRDRSGDDWVADPVLARGRSHSLYGTAKDGKSLFALYLTACLATGVAPFRPGRPRCDPVRVLYLDWEMTDDDLYDRLPDLGYGPTTDLDHLDYHPLADLAPLDTPTGAADVCTLVDHYRSEVVVVDPVSRAVQGEESSNDTIRAYYRHTVAPLKARGITQLRVDNTGHDGSHARGASGKRDDVDVEWRLTTTATGLTLTAKHARMSWVPTTVAFRKVTDPVLAFHLVERRGYLAGAADLAAVLDRLGVPVDASRSSARAAMVADGATGGTDVLRDALRLRRERDRR